MKYKNKKIVKMFSVGLFFLVLFIFSNRISFADSTDGKISNEPAFLNAQKTIEAIIFSKSGSYTVSSLSIISVQRPYLESFEIYKGKSFNGVITTFNAEALGYFDPGNMETAKCSDLVEYYGKKINGCEGLYEGGIILNLPYFPNGKYADIYSPDGKKILTIDLSSKTTCNESGVCDRPIEDSINCPQDCKDAQPVIDVPVVVLHAQPLIVSQKTYWEKAKPFAIIAAAIVAFITGIAFVVAYMRRRNEY